MSIEGIGITRCIYLFSIWYRMNIKRLFSDISFRTLSSIISTGVQQLVVLPILALCFSPEFYGTILTFRGIFNTVSLGFGNALKSTRMISNTNYNTNKTRGDFNFLAWGSALICVIVLFIISLFIKELDYVEVVLLLPSVFLATLNAYYIVYYFLFINYKGLLICSIVTAFGALLGVLLVKFTHLWPLADLVAGSFTFYYLIKRTGLIKEPFTRTPLIKGTLGIYSILIITTLIGQGVSYLDRLFLYPIIGGSAVAIYSTAAFFGKSIAVLITPISSVLLSYYCQDDFKMSLKYFWSSNLIVFVLALLFVIASLLLAPWVTRLLYPTLIDSARPFIFLANLAAIIGVCGNVTQSAVLKFSNIKWQIFIELVYSFVYVVIGLMTIPSHGLLGFCYVVLMANVLRFFVLLLIGHFSISKMSNSN